MTEKKPTAVLVGPGLRGVGLMHLMAAAAAAAGCNIEFGGPGPMTGRDMEPRGRRQPPRHDLLLPLQLRGKVEHTYTPKPLTKRQKRRLRGKEKQA